MIREFHEFSNLIFGRFLRFGPTMLCASGYWLVARTAKRTSQDLNECDSLVFTRKKDFVLSHSSMEILKHGSAWTMVRLGGPVGGLI